MRAPVAALALCLAALPPAAWGGQPRSAGSAAALAGNAALMKAGDYRAAVEGYMDMVIAEPGDRAARAGLREAAARALGAERRLVDAERAALLAGAGRDKRRLDALAARKASRLAGWRNFLSRTRALAARAETVREAVTAYERLLETAPVYSDDREELLAACASVKEVFFGTIRKEFPYLVEGRDHADERDIASLQFSKISSRDESDRYLDTGSTQEVLARADKFRRLERELAAQHGNLVKGLALYARGRLPEALELFEKAIAFDARNEEALFYSGLAREKLGAKRDQDSGKR